MNRVRTRRRREYVHRHRSSNTDVAVRRYDRSSRICSLAIFLVALPLSRCVAVACMGFAGHVVAGLPGGSAVPVCASSASLIVVVGARCAPLPLGGNLFRYPRAQRLMVCPTIGNSGPTIGPSSATTSGRRPVRCDASPWAWRTSGPTGGAPRASGRVLAEFGSARRGAASVFVLAVARVIEIMVLRNRLGCSDYRTPERSGGAGVR